MTTFLETDPKQILEQAEQVLAPVYARPEVLFTSGHGTSLIDAEGKEFLDMTSGIAVTAFGHDADIVRRATESGDGLVHTSNLYHTRPAIDLARALVECSFADRVFFCNSGAEAIEGAIKFARLHAGDPSKRTIVHFEGSFHGRTLGALASTDRPDYQDPFRPLPGGFLRLPFADEDALRKIDRSAAAVLVEPIQGESGIRTAPPDWLRALRRRCDETGTLLVFDEIQCGLGRTGRLWAHQDSGVEPDLMTLAKPLAAGLPIGAVLMKEAVSASLHPGCHGTTFGGGPIVCRAAAEVLSRVRRPELLSAVTQKGALLREWLETLPVPGIEEVRGRGLMIGIRTRFTAAEVVARAFERALLVVPAGDQVIRLLPPLTVTRDDLQRAVERLASALQAVESGGTRS